MNTRLIIMLALFKTCFLGHLNGQDKVWTKQDSCFSYLESYSDYWKKDKLGKNGLRKLMADLILNKCDFAGRKWKDIHKYLGDPNVSFTMEGKWYYRYRLNYLSDDIKDIGTELLEIEVDSKGFVIGFSIYFIDG